MLESLKLERIDATKLQRRAEAGLVIANLPYGKRVGERDELGQLYRLLGQSLREACAGWYFGFLLEGGGEHLALKVDEQHEVTNGGIGCRVVLGRI